MNYKKLIPQLIIFAIISWTCLALVILKLEPCLVYSAKTFCEKVSSLGMIMFYISLFFALTSTFSLIGFLSRIYFNNNEIFASHFNVAIRQGILLSICLITCTILLTANILKWWNTIIIFALIIFIEFYFINREKIPEEY
jgi:hypothetical protein